MVLAREWSSRTRPLQAALEVHPGNSIMIRRRLSQSLWIATSAAIFASGYAALAQKPATRPAGADQTPATLRVVSLDPRKAYLGYSKGDALQKRFMSLQKEL